MQDLGNPDSAPDVNIDLPFELIGTKVDLTVVTGTPTVCAGSIVSLTAVPPDAAASYQYAWSAPEGFTLSATNTSQVTAAVSPTLTGEYTFTVVATTASSSTITSTVSVTVLNTGITVQPVAASVVCAGVTISAAASVTGDASGYQWYKDDSPVDGQTTATLSLPTVTAANSGTYKLEVSTSGCSSLTSSPFSLTVNSPLDITMQPASSSVVCAGATVSVVPSVTGTATGYQWYRNGNPFGSSTATLTPLIFSPVQPTDEGRYTLVITGVCTSVTSTGFSLTVNSTTVSISPPSPFINKGESILLTASGADSYIWSTQATGNIISVSPDQTTLYSVTGSKNDCSGSASATVTVSCPPFVQAAGTSITQSGALWSGNCSVMLIGSGYGNLLQLTGPGGYVYSGVYRKAGNYTVNGLNVTQPGTYTFKVSYTDSCGERSSDTRTYVLSGTACR